MKRFLVAAVFMALASVQAQSQNLSAGAAAGSQSQSGAQAGANSGSAAGASVTQVYNNAGATTTTLSGTRTLKTAPNVLAPSLGSGHPCMINTSVGFSVIGGGVSGGTGTVDSGCMMMRSGNATDNMAGRYYYAAKDVTACQAWKRAGMFPIDYPCTKAEQKAASTSVSTSGTFAPATSPRPKARPVGYTVCSYDRASNKIALTIKSGYDKPAARAACLSSLGF